jgi:type II secretory pathway component GspD/PulD (secretin)
LKKRARVIVVADERTASVVVSAAQQLMDQIERVVTQLDLNPAGRQTVKMYQIKNAHPQELTQVLEDIFQKNSAANNNRSSATQNDPLATRITTQSQQSNSSSRTGPASNNRSGSGSAGSSLQ